MMQAIVDAELPEERQVFDLVGRTFVGELFKQGYISTESTKDKSDDHYDLVDPAAVKELIELVGLLSGSFKLVQEVATWVGSRMRPNRGVTLEEVEAEWTRVLINEGMDPDLAKRISRRFTGDLTEQLRPALPQNAGS
jgi:hypothetical protein